MFKRGDPDPTPELRGRMKCPARIVKPGNEGREQMALFSYYECTWPYGEHDPDQHVAGALRADGTGYVAWVWNIR